MPIRTLKRHWVLSEWRPVKSYMFFNVIRSEKLIRFIPLCSLSGIPFSSFKHSDIPDDSSVSTSCTQTSSIEHTCGDIIQQTKNRAIRFSKAVSDTGGMHTGSHNQRDPLQLRQTLSVGDISNGVKSGIPLRSASLPGSNLSNKSVYTVISRMTESPTSVLSNTKRNEKYKSLKQSIRQYLSKELGKSNKVHQDSKKNITIQELQPRRLHFSSLSDFQTKTPINSTEIYSDPDKNYSYESRVIWRDRNRRYKRRPEEYSHTYGLCVDYWLRDNENKLNLEKQLIFDPQELALYNELKALPFFPYHLRTRCLLNYLIRCHYSLPKEKKPAGILDIVSRTKTFENFYSFYKEHFKNLSYTPVEKLQSKTFSKDLIVTTPNVTFPAIINVFEHLDNTSSPKKPLTDLYGFKGTYLKKGSCTSKECSGSRFAEAAFDMNIQLTKSFIKGKRKALGQVINQYLDSKIEHGICGVCRTLKLEGKRQNDSPVKWTGEALQSSPNLLGVHVINGGVFPVIEEFIHIKDKPYKLAGVIIEFPGKSPTIVYPPHHTFRQTSGLTQWQSNTWEGSVSWDILNPKINNFAQLVQFVLYEKE